MHATDIFALAVSPSQILTGSGEPSIKIHSTTADDFAIAQVLKDVHKLGCHHIAIDEKGTRAVSVGFGGEVRVWKFDEGIWKDDGEVHNKGSSKETAASKKKAGEVWAVALSLDGQHLASTTHDGRVNVWDLGGGSGRQRIGEFETKGSFGMCVDLVSLIHRYNCGTVPEDDDNHLILCCSRLTAAS